MSKEDLTSKDLTFEKGQEKIDEWFRGLPREIDELYNSLVFEIQRFNSFDLLSYIAYYNHLHSLDKYQDNRGDKHFFVPEILALLCLKSGFIKESTISKENYIDYFEDIQQKILKYSGFRSVHDEALPDLNEVEDPISEVTKLLSREAQQIRNPGFPEHHMEFSAELFKPFMGDIKSELGFSIEDSIIIRKALPEFINKKCKTAINATLRKGEVITKEIYNFHKKGTPLKTCNMKIEDLKKCTSLNYSELKKYIQGYLLNELFYDFSNTYTFSTVEISQFTQLEINVVTSFLKLFSCSFLDVKPSDSIVEPNMILKTKPLIEYDNKYLIPSLPLLIWAVEEVVEGHIASWKKKKEKYVGVKHDFLLSKGLNLFDKLLPTAKIFKPNLFYNHKGERFETDAIVIYDRLLIIIEAKGNRISRKAKGGHKLRTLYHLEHLVKDSYNQAFRTIEFIKENINAQFKTKSGEKVNINKNDFDEVILVSLTLEPIGNLAMLLKVTNEFGFFKNDIFPLIISLYDLIIFSDLIESPIMFIDYIKQRQKFLSNGNIKIYEELDLLSHYFKNGLYIDGIINEANENNVNQIYFSPDTDEINDYYMYKFGKKDTLTPKPRSNISVELVDFLNHINTTLLPNRVNVGLALLEFDLQVSREFFEKIRKYRNKTLQDQSCHYFSRLLALQGGIGITYMTGVDKNQLEAYLLEFCKRQKYQYNVRRWIGIGDIALDKNYDIQVIIHI